MAHDTSKGGHLRGCRPFLTPDPDGGRSTEEVRDRRRMDQRISCTPRAPAPSTAPEPTGPDVM